MVLHRHTLRAAGRAGRVHHVGEAGRRGAAGGVHVVTGVVGAAAEQRVVQADYLGAVPTDRVCKTPLGQQDLGAGVGDHVGHPSLRIGRIERQVSAAGLQHAQQPYHHLGGALHAHPDQPVRPDPKRLERAGHPVRAAVELAVGEPFRAPDQRRGVRRAARPAPRTTRAGRHQQGTAPGWRCIPPAGGDARRRSASGGKPHRAAAPRRRSPAAAGSAPSAARWCPGPKRSALYWKRAGRAPWASVISSIRS